MSDVLTMLVLFSNHTEFVQIARVDLQGYELPCGIMAELSCANGWQYFACDNVKKRRVQDAHAMRMRAEQMDNWDSGEISRASIQS